METWISLSSTRLPANRLPIKNCVVDREFRIGKKRTEFHSKMKSETGHQAYVICPMVEESEMRWMRRTSSIIHGGAAHASCPPAFCIEYLHGKMKPKEKNEIMERFAGK